MKVHELTVKRADQLCGLHACLRHVLRLARWTGFFPVQGLGQTYADGTRFKLKSFYCCHYIAALLGQVVLSCFSILYFFESEVDLSTISNIIFYVTGLISAILLLKLSQQWPQLMTKATETEQGLTELKLENKTVVQATVIAYVFMSLALVEHILCTNFNVRFVMNCLQEPGITSNVMENYVIYRMPYVFKYVSYSAFTALVFEYICLQATFLWSFNDVMITCFSIYITAYFRNFNEVIAANVKKKKNGIPWSVLRVHYTNLVKLVKEIDVQISSFILTSFFTDLFYICLQLFNSLHRNYVNFKYCDEAQTSQGLSRKGPIQIRKDLMMSFGDRQRNSSINARKSTAIAAIAYVCIVYAITQHNITPVPFKGALSSPYYLLYYLYSAIFLVLRTLMLSLYASNVHCAGLEPVYHIYDIPSSVYDIEVRRFQLQLHYTNVGLSGKFFYVTRTMILKVVGTIITYEIVLLQYSITPTYYNGTTMATIVENNTGVY